MSIKYSLIPNHLTDDPDDYMAVVQDQTTRTIDDIIAEMVERGSTVTRADILSVYEELKAVVKKFLRNGDRINTDLFRTSTSITGTFNDVSDSFDRSRHHVRHNMIPGAEVVSEASEVPVEKVPATLVRPVLEYFHDFVSGTRSQTLTPGGSAEIRGSHLKVDPEDAEQGIYFIGPDGVETKVQMIMRNMPADLIFDIPEGLAPGEYYVEVRMSPKDNDSDIRIGRLNAVLIVS